MGQINWKQMLPLLHKQDKETFAALYQELRKPVFTIVFRIVQSKETAEDLTQDLFVKLFLSPPDLSVKNPRAWIFQTARNLAIDAYRKKQCTSLDELSLSEEDPSPALVQKLDLERAIAKLACEEREVLSLHLNASLSFREIAKITGSSLSGVYRSYRSALRALRSEMEGDAL